MTCPFFRNLSATPTPSLSSPPGFCRRSRISPFNSPCCCNWSSACATSCSVVSWKPLTWMYPMPGRIMKCTSTLYRGISSPPPSTPIRFLVAPHVEFDRLVGALAQHCDLHRGPFGSLQQVRHIAGAHVVGGFAVDRDDHVSRTNARPVSRSPGKRRDDDDL